MTVKLTRSDNTIVSAAIDMLEDICDIAAKYIEDPAVSAFVMHHIHVAKKQIIEGFK